jgi:cytochrome c551/c552
LFVVLYPIVLFVGLVLLPFVDRSPYRGIRRRPIMAIVVAVCVISLIYLSDYRRRSPFTGWPTDQPPAVPAGVILTEEHERGRLLFTEWGCMSCHSVAGDGREVGTDLARLRHRYSKDELMAYIRQPPPGIPMPPYDGRIPEDELDLIVEFVLAAQAWPRE